MLCRKTFSIEMPHVPRWRQRRKNRLTRAVAVNPSLHMEAAGLGEIRLK